jgi:hypothetical protein
MERQFSRRTKSRLKGHYKVVPSEVCAAASKPLLGLWKRLEAKGLERQIDAYLSRIQISERLRDRAVTSLLEFHDREIARRNEILQSQQRAYEDCLKRLDHLVKFKTSPKNADGSLLSDEEHVHQHMEFLKEKVRLAEEKRLQAGGTVHAVGPCGVAVLPEHRGRAQDSGPGASGAVHYRRMTCLLGERAHVRSSCLLHAKGAVGVYHGGDIRRTAPHEGLGDLQCRRASLSRHTWVAARLGAASRARCGRSARA